jgi:ankyrin repeat protein
MAVELMAALERGDVGRLRRLLAAHPELACHVVENAKGAARTALHLFADWPGHRPNAVAIVRALVEAGADLDAPAVGMWHRETPLHWAASNDDVALIDALLDAGADIERAGSSIDGGSPLSCAVGYGQWAAARRLVERGARTLFWHEATLGLMSPIKERAEANPPPQPEQLSGAFWNACHGGQLAVAQYLLAHGVDLNWPAPWSEQTPLDIARKAARSDIVAWLIGKGATAGEEKRLMRRPLFRKPY